MIKAGMKVKVIDVDLMWDKERYISSFKCYTPERFIENGDIASLIEVDCILGRGIQLVFDNGDISQVYPYIPFNRNKESYKDDEMSAEYLEKALKILENVE